MSEVARDDVWTGVGNHAAAALVRARARARGRDPHARSARPAQRADLRGLSRAGRDVRAARPRGRTAGGGDQDDIIQHLLGRDAPALLAFTRATGRLIASMRTCKRPIVAAINGTAV